MKEAAFWCFFGFAVLTVLVAFGGGVFALVRFGGGARTLGFLLFFLGASLAFMLGSLLFIQTKERKRSK